MTNRNQDSNCSSFNNKTMFDDFNGFVGGNRNSFSGKSNMPINWSNAKGMSKAPNKSVVPNNNTDLYEGGCGSVQIYCPDGSYHRVNINKCTSGDCDDCIGRATARFCRSGNRTEMKSKEAKNFTGMGSTFPKGSGSYFDGNNRMRQGRAMDNGGLRLR